MDIKYASECLLNLHRLWRRPVHLQARLKDEMLLFTCGGDNVTHQKIRDDLPKPAHTNV